MFKVENYVVWLFTLVLLMIMAELGWLRYCQVGTCVMDILGWTSCFLLDQDKAASPISRSEQHHRCHDSSHSVQQDVVQQRVVSMIGGMTLPCRVIIVLLPS